MGTMLEQYGNIERLKRSSAVNFTAEVFFDELQFVMQENLLDGVIVRNHGMNSRVMSKDILDVTMHYKSTPTTYKEYVVLHLARNSLYHRLPEMLFHPLVLSAPTMSNREVVDAMRSNRKKEQDNINFFEPFDTAFFKERVKINNRYLNFFSDTQSRKNLLRIAGIVLDVDLSVEPHESYKLFLKACNAESLKENIPELEALLKTVLGLDVKLRYKAHMINEFPFGALNDSILGFSLGLSGEVKSELDDVEAIISFAQRIENYAFLQKTIDTVRSILHFFFIAARTIHISYAVTTSTNFVLDDSYLGYDANL